MQKWEYATIVSSHIGDEGRNTPSPNINPPEGNIFEMLNHLGEQGWELTSTLSHSFTTAEESIAMIDSYVLKRPKEN